MADVLLVDDEKSVRSTLAIMLSKSGYNVVEAGNGPDALGMMKEQFYDLIITDLKMEPMTGLELLKKTKDVNPATEVILMTAFGTVESGVEAMKLGAMDLIEKPTDIETIAEKIKKAQANKIILVEKKTEEKIRKIITTKGW